MKYIDGHKYIIVNRDVLLDSVTTNREQHRGLFLQACDGFRKEAIRQIEGVLTEAKAGRDFSLHIGLVAPADHTRDYDRVIRSLQMQVDSQTMLTETEFAQYVMDDWSWKRDFLVTCSSYSTLVN